MSKSKQSLKSLYNKFLRFEQDLGLFERKIDDVFFWERIRFTVFQRTFQKTLIDQDKDPRIKKPPKERSISTYLLKFRNYFLTFFRFKRNPLLAKQHDVLILSSTRRKLQEDNLWWDIYTDYFIEKLDYSAISLEGDLFFKYRKPVKTKNLLYTTYIDFLVDMKRYLKLSRVKLTDEEIIYLRKLSQTIKTRFKLSIDLVFLTTHILTKRKRSLPYFFKILDRIKPKVVIVVCSYGKEDFIEACKIKKIPVAEIQHGVITKYHVGYSYEKKNAVKYTFPDYLLTFGNYWKDSVSYPIEKDHIFSVGYPEFEHKKKRYKNIKKKKQILFISQKTIGEQLSRFAVELSKIRKFDYKILYKLHPFEADFWYEDYPWLAESNIQIVDHLGKPLYKLFAESEIQIGVYSTALFEGLSFGVKTLLVDLPGIDYMEDLIDNNTAIKVEKAKELISLLHNKDVKPADSEKFFRSGAVQNIKKAICEIIELRSDEN